MSPTAKDGNSQPQTWTARILGAFTGPSSSSVSSEEQGDRPEILPQQDRKAAMSSLDPNEAKWTLGALVLATVAGIAIPLYFIAENKVTKEGKNSIAVAPDAKLLGGVILVLCAIGFAALVEAEAHARGVRPLPPRVRVHVVRRAHRVRFHPSWRILDAAGLAPQ